MRELARIMRLLCCSYPAILLAVGVGTATVISNVGLMSAAAYLISAAALHPAITELSVAIVAVRFFGISRGIFRYLDRYITHDITFQLLSRLRTIFYQAIEPLVPAGIAGYQSGDLLSRFVKDVETLQYVYLRIVAPVFVALAAGFAVTVFLGWFDVMLAGCLLATFFTLGIVIPYGFSIAYRESRNEQIATQGQLQGQTLDLLRGMTELNVYGGLEEHLRKIHITEQALTRQQERLSAFQNIAAVFAGLTANIGMWVLFVSTIELVQSGSLSGTYLAMVVLAGYSSFEAFMPLALIPMYVDESSRAAKRVFGLIGAPVDITQDEGSKVTPTEYGIEIKDVFFRYIDDGPWILKGIDLQIAEGGKVALVGPSGSGKSSLINVLLRFWDYQGRVYLGNYDIKSVEPDSLREIFAVVSQHTYLFNGTIRENLLLANPCARDEEIYEATRQARIDDFIHQLPAGLETHIGEGGYLLSGGQRQRLAIARAYLKDAPILILDEATASIDPVAEQAVMEAMHHLMEHKTVLVITHNVTGLQQMDKIFVMKEGCIVEEGDFDTLLQQEKSLFRRMWCLQNGCKSLSV